jgi:hypothetical protein
MLFLKRIRAPYPTMMVLGVFLCGTGFAMAYFIHNGSLSATLLDASYIGLGLMMIIWAKLLRGQKKI